MEVTNGGSKTIVILGDPLDVDGAVFSLKMDSSSVYSASIDGQSQYSLVSFLSSDGE